MINSTRLVALTAVAAAVIAFVTGCASSKRPVLYPNQHLVRVGSEQARRDVDACIALADASGVSRHRDGEVVRKSVTGSVAGAAGAGTAALVLGKDPKYALAGAAGGAAAGAVRGGIDSTEINPVFRNFVQRCLHEKGYDVIGWE